jgi:transposase IS66-like protein
LSLHDNQITRHQNIACVIAVSRQSSSRRDRRNGHPDCRCVPIQIVALHAADRGRGRPRQQDLSLLQGLNDVDPLAYLTDVLTRIVNGHPNRDIDQLLPWAYQPQALKAVA